MTNLEKTKSEYFKEIKLGIDNTRKKNLNLAEKNFLKAIDLIDDEYTAYLNLGNLYLIQQKHEKAIIILSNYLKKYNYNQLLAELLIKTFYNFNCSSDIESFFNEFRINVNDTSTDKYQIHFFVARYYEKVNKINKAIDFYEKSIQSNSNNSLAFIYLFDLLERTNQLEKFEHYLKISKRFNSLDRNYYRILYYNCLILNRKKKYQSSENKISELNLYNNFKKDNFYLSKLLDLISKNNEKIKNYKKSADSIIERNKIIINSQNNNKHSRDSILKTIDAYKKFYKKEMFSDLNFFSEQKDKRLTFLIGFPRSGTTLLDTILRSHSKTIIIEEKPHLLNCRHNFFKNKDNNLDSINKITKEEVSNLRNIYFNNIGLDNSNENKVIIDKFPLNIIEMGFIKIIFPNAKIILALRHPCDVAISCFFSNFKINEAMINFLKWDHTIQFYDKVFELFEIYEKETGLEIYKIKYENVVNSFEKEINNLLKFLGLKFEKNLINFFETASKRERIATPSYSQVINPIYKTSIGRWKNYTDILNAEKSLSKWIKKFEY